MAIIVNDVENRVKKAVAHYWQTLDKQASNQQEGVDHGRRGAVTGGKQMVGFCEVVKTLLVENGCQNTSIHTDKDLVLPGYFRPTKNWDMVVMHHDHLLAAVEFKSQRGPSFGNNFNNRAEEAIGTAKDLWVAYRENGFGKGVPRPWLGWVMLLEDCPASTRAVKLDEPHFKAFPEFQGSSYAKRYEILLQKLGREKLFDATSLLLSTDAQGVKGVYSEPAADLSMKKFLASLAGHVAAVLAGE